MTKKLLFRWMIGCICHFIICITNFLFKTIRIRAQQLFDSTYRILISVIEKSRAQFLYIVVIEKNNAA